MSCSWAVCLCLPSGCCCCTRQTGTLTWLVWSFLDDTDTDVLTVRWMPAALADALLVFVETLVLVLVLVFVVEMFESESRTLSTCSLISLTSLRILSRSVRPGSLLLDCFLRMTTYVRLGSVGTDFCVATRAGALTFPIRGQS